MDVAPYVWIAEPASAEHDATPRAATAAERGSRDRQNEGASLVRPAPAPRGLPPADNAWLDATETDLAAAAGGALAALDIRHDRSGALARGRPIDRTPGDPGGGVLAPKSCACGPPAARASESKDDMRAARAWQSRRGARWRARRGCRRDER
ncbi:MAG: hypothetical protein U0235_30390 [Polyangiaceae bacterium]